MLTSTSSLGVMRLRWCGCFAVLQAELLYFKPANQHNVTFDERSAIIDGTPTLMLSGAIHYTRVHQDEWSRVFGLAVELGLNTIQV